MNLVNATYFTAAIGIHRSQAKKILNKSAKVVSKRGNEHLYNKKEVDAIVKEYKRVKDVKAEYEWDIKDIEKHFGLSRSYIQMLVNRNGFPEPVRSIAVNKGRYARLWIASEVKAIDLKKLPEGKRKARIVSTKQPSITGLREVEKQFIRGFL
jgi:predicted DNA-binding transcriptional regulator AlpA